MQIKMIEIRDECTCIAAMAIQVEAANMTELVFMQRCGYPGDGSSIILMHFDNQKATNDPYGWIDLRMGSRTMPNAHQYILEHWDEIKSGQVVDVRVILGEKMTPAENEIHA